MEILVKPKVGLSSLYSASSSSWVERLCMNLFSYLIILLPVAFIVIATKRRLFPPIICSNALISWFVYGSNPNNHIISSDQQLTEDDRKLLIDDGRLKPIGQKRDHQRNFSEVLEFFACLLGLQISYLTWGLLQEKIMTSSYPLSSTARRLQVLAQTIRPFNSSYPVTIAPKTVTFHDSQFLVLINRIVAFFMAILALVYVHRRRIKLHMSRLESTGSFRPSIYMSGSARKPQAPLYQYLYCSLSNILSSWCQYEALKFVNFPTQCLSKSCKIIPVMLMSRILMSKRYSHIDYLCAILLVTGMFVFMFNQTQPRELHHESNLEDVTPKNTSNYALDHKTKNSLLVDGIIILALYLTFDSFTSNWQQSLYSRFEISNWQMMAAINFYSILLTLTSLHQLGNLGPAFSIVASSTGLMRDCLIMSIMSSVGQIFVYHTIKRFGSVLFAVIMTLRQCLSIVLSCTIYHHQISLSSGLGMTLVFGVVAFQVWYKSKRRKCVSG